MDRSIFNQSNNVKIVGIPITYTNIHKRRTMFRIGMIMLKRSYGNVYYYGSLRVTPIAQSHCSKSYAVISK